MFTGCMVVHFFSAPLCRSPLLAEPQTGLGKNEPPTALGTSSPAIAERPRDTSCLSVVSFNNTIRRMQSSVISYLGCRFTAAHKLCSLLFGVFNDAWRFLYRKQTCTVTVIHYCTDDLQLLIAHCYIHRSIAS